MTSIFELGQCCDAVYSEAPIVKGWDTERIYKTYGGGFFGALFTKQDEVVLAFRGTDDSSYDVLNDAEIALAITPIQYNNAKSALQDAMRRKNSSLLNGNFIVTGHSLGGGLAALASAKNIPPAPVVTFNSPGMNNTAVNSIFGFLGLVRNYFKLREYRSELKKIIHIRSEYDVVSIGTGAKIAGITRTLPDSKCGAITSSTSILSSVSPMSPMSLMSSTLALNLMNNSNRAVCAHRMKNMLELLNNIPEFHQPISWS